MRETIREFFDHIENIVRADEERLYPNVVKVHKRINVSAPNMSWDSHNPYKSFQITLAVSSYDKAATITSVRLNCGEHVFYCAVTLTAEQLRDGRDDLTATIIGWFKTMLAVDEATTAKFRVLAPQR
jgi:hypothetical protein